MSSIDEAENGNGRATVALVNAKVETVDVKIDGVRTLIESEFKDIRLQLAGLGALDAKVDGMNDRLLLLEGRVATIERRNDSIDAVQKDQRSYWRDTFPTHLISAASFALAVVVAIQQFS